MASFRPLGQFNQFLLNNGAVNNGGSITFYETDLTTLKNTYSDPGLTVLNANPVVLDAAGRLSTDVWGSGVYGAVLKDSLGTTIQTLNNIQSGADPGLAIPSLISDNFLTNDGSNLLWSLIRQVPDPTGQSGNILSNDGTISFWKSISSLGIPTISASGSVLELGPWRIQIGSSSAPASGFRQTGASPTFTVPFSSPPYYIGVIATTVTSCAGLQIAVPAITGRSTTGFTVQFDSDDYSQVNAQFTGPVTFDYFAIGPK